MKPIVRNIKTNDLYQYEGEKVFTNLRTGKGGEIDDDLARKSFVINVEATQMINEFPIIADLIKTLNLKIVKK